jgi:hypothetical protein
VTKGLVDEVEARELWDMSVPGSCLMGSVTDTAASSPDATTSCRSGIRATTRTSRSSSGRHSRQMVYWP